MSQSLKQPLSLPVVFVLALASHGFPAEPSQQAERSFSDLTGPWQLLVDDYLIDDLWRVRRNYHAFAKHPDNPLITADTPSEHAVVFLYGTVLPDGKGGYRMWYHGGNGRYHSHYATSKDGIHWDKPKLGLFAYKGSRDNNLIIRDGLHHPLVVHTPADTRPDHRYKMMFYGQFHNGYRHGFFGAHSPDGIRWSNYKPEPLIYETADGGRVGDVGLLAWDPHENRYLAYPKISAEVRGYLRRCVGFTTTKDFENWPKPELVLVPDEADDRWVWGPNQRTEFYGMAGFAYETMYLGFLWVFRVTSLPDCHDGELFIELVTSRDGKSWRRIDCPRAPLLALGRPGTWDDGQLYTANHPLVEGNQIKLWYSGWDETHGLLPERDEYTAGIGLATLRKDGWASIDAYLHPGHLTTKPLAGAKGELRVNHKTRGRGWLKVEVLDAKGQVVPGYHQDVCQPLTGDAVDAKVRWSKHDKLPAQLDRIRLRFQMKNVSLYSFMPGENVRLAEKPSTKDGLSITLYGDTRRDGTRLTFPEPVSRRSTAQVKGSARLGKTFTLAARINTNQARWQRVFSSYRGSGPPDGRELIIDIDPSGKVVKGLHVILKGRDIRGSAVQIDAGKLHHLAVTHNDGDVRLYLDAKPVGRHHVGPGPVTMFSDLHVGEDVGGPPNEQFVGHIDNVLILDRALSGKEIAALATKATPNGR